MAQRWIDRVGIRLDREADVPVGVQLAWALGGAVRSGALAPGDRLPPLRELAVELGVNANTLRAVYARLERAGLIELRHGSGTYVTPTPPAHDLEGLVATAARAARDAGVDPRELAAALYVTPGAKDGRDAERRRALREEIAVLERVLSRLPAVPPTTRRAAGPHLLSLPELESQRDALVAQIGSATRPPAPEPKAPVKRPAKAKARAAKRAPRLGPATA